MKRAVLYAGLSYVGVDQEYVIMVLRRISQPTMERVTSDETYNELHILNSMQLFIRFIKSRHVR